MTSILTRSSVLALKKETTEGTPVLPTAATDYLALQDDFSASPSFNVLDNAELKASIGKAKSILGSEAPTASFSHYLRSSGTAGTAPNFGLLLEACFGSVVTASTEYDTVAGSTTTVVNVDVGEGTNFQRGQALLIKDGTNGYRIRSILSVSADALTLGFKVPVAPGTGVNLGKAVLYKPANTGHPSLTLWHYLGNGGAIQMLAGCRVTSISYAFTAGELINGSYSLEGIAFYFDPITVTSTDTKLDFTDDDGTWAATVTAKTYKDPHDLASAIQTAMLAANPLQTPTVTYDNLTGKFNIKTTGTLLSLLWNTGSNTANTIGDKIGYSTASDDTGTAATTGYNSDNAVSYASPQTPSFDNADALAAKDNEVMLGDQVDYVCFEASSVTVDISTPKADKSSVCAVSGISGSIITSREVKISVSALLNQYDADKWKRFRSNSNAQFQYSFGEKSGGNWIAGKCGDIFIPTATITSLSIDDQDGQAQINLELTAYVDSSGNGEVYLNTL
jgi:hypothetical protein